MTVRSILAAMMACLHTVDHGAPLTRAIAENVHAQKKRRSAATSMVMAADTEGEGIETTLHRIEGRSNDRRTAGEDAMKVAEAALQFVNRDR